MQNKKNWIKNIISIFVLILAIFIFANVYSKYSYNDFIKSVREDNKTKFTRDSEEKYSKTDSYKIENQDFNDALFYQTVSVTPNMPYKVTCKVKVANVENTENVRTGRSSNLYFRNYRAISYCKWYKRLARTYIFI